MIDKFMIKIQRITAASVEIRVPHLKIATLVAGLYIQRDGYPNTNKTPTSFGDFRNFQRKDIAAYETLFRLPFGNWGSGLIGSVTSYQDLREPYSQVEADPGYTLYQPQPSYQRESATGIMNNSFEIDSSELLQPTTYKMYTMTPGYPGIAIDDVGAAVLNPLVSDYPMYYDAGSYIVGLVYITPCK